MNVEYLFAWTLNDLPKYTGRAVEPADVDGRVTRVVKKVQKKPPEQNARPGAGGHAASATACAAGGLCEKMHQRNLGVIRIFALNLCCLNLQWSMKDQPY